MILRYSFILIFVLFFCNTCCQRYKDDRTDTSKEREHSSELLRRGDTITKTPHKRRSHPTSHLLLSSTSKHDIEWNDGQKGGYFENVREWFRGFMGRGKGEEEEATMNHRSHSEHKNLINGGKSRHAYARDGEDEEDDDGDEDVDSPDHDTNWEEEEDSYHEKVIKSSFTGDQADIVQAKHTTLIPGRAVSTSFLKDNKIGNELVARNLEPEILITTSTTKSHLLRAGVAVARSALATEASLLNLKDYLRGTGKIRFPPSDDPHFPTLTTEPGMYSTKSVGSGGVINYITPASSSDTVVKPSGIGNMGNQHDELPGFESPQDNAFVRVKNKPKNQRSSLTGDDAVTPNSNDSSDIETDESNDLVGRSDDLLLDDKDHPKSHDAMISLMKRESKLMTYLMMRSKNGNRKNCSGYVVAKEHILTVAQCVIDIDQDKSWIIVDDQVVRITSFTVHGGFHTSGGVATNDIAVIKFDQFNGIYVGSDHSIEHVESLLEGGNDDDELSRRRRRNLKFDYRGHDDVHSPKSTSGMNGHPENFGEKNSGNPDYIDTNEERKDDHFEQEIFIDDQNERNSGSFELNLKSYGSKDNSPKGFRKSKDHGQEKSSDDLNEPNNGRSGSNLKVFDGNISSKGSKKSEVRSNQIVQRSDRSIKEPKLEQLRASARRQYSLNSKNSDTGDENIKLRSESDQESSGLDSTNSTIPKSKNMEMTSEAPIHKINQTTVYQWDRRGRKTDRIIFSVVNLKTHDECNLKMYSKKFTLSHLCAFNDGPNRCDRDLGSLLVIDIPRGVHVIGLYSYTESCDNTDSPSVFTNVHHFLDWLDEITSGHG